LPSGSCKPEIGEIKKGYHLAKYTKIVFVSSDETRIKQIKIYKHRFFIYFTLFVIAFLVSGKYALDFLINISQNSRIETLTQNNNFLKARLNEMNTVVNNIEKQLSVVVQKDDELRTVLGLSQIDQDIRDVGIGGTSFKYDLTDGNYDGEYAADAYAYMSTLDKLQREVKLELSSFNSLINTYNQKEDSLKYLPALHPLISGRVSSVMGMRFHPVLKVYRYHPGLDIAAKSGTPIYATADGVVKFAKYNGGYGKVVYLNHKYGYETRYGHMSKILVRVGQRVKRGDKIGLVGRTGIVTAPHLHYEVRYKGDEVDPRKFFFNDSELNNLVVNRQ